MLPPHLRQLRQSYNQQPSPSPKRRHSTNLKSPRDGSGALSNGGSRQMRIEDQKRRHMYYSPYNVHEEPKWGGSFGVGSRFANQAQPQTDFYYDLTSDFDRIVKKHADKRGRTPAFGSSLGRFAEFSQSQGPPPGSYFTTTSNKSSRRRKWTRGSPTKRQQQQRRAPQWPIDLDQEFLGHKRPQSSPGFGSSAERQFLKESNNGIYASSRADAAHHDKYAPNQQQQHDFTSYSRSGQHGTYPFNAKLDRFASFHNDSPPPTKYNVDGIDRMLSSRRRDAKRSKRR